jgi:2-polyprenyl-3-methyl-5-hydroxy-6-metoxy-1,4-benzoquinol methylase
MTEFVYQEVDVEGMETLDVIAGADKFNRWMYDTINPYCKDRIIEIGSGIGNISKFFIDAQQDITLTDIRENYVAALKSKFEGKASAIELMDLTDPGFDSRYAHLINTFDTVFALNVVEHIKDDTLAIANCKKLLKKHGHLIILVPAYQSLYNQFDLELQHFKRYNKKTLGSLFTKNAIKVIHQQYFNVMGIFGWFISGKLQKNKTIPGGQMKLYNLLVPVFKLVDIVSFRSFGLSVVTVGKKE